MSKDLEKKNNKELILIDETAQKVINYSEDDRRKADDLYTYYKSLIEAGDKKGETREGLAKALELREKSVQNLIEILKIKAKVIEKKILAESRKNNPIDNLRNVGSDNSNLINEIEDI